MRQRLALAAVLLKDPALLILDEPANGLDPAGIRDVRTLLRSLGDEGRTVFVSSHVLAEVEHTCDSVAILRRGRCVAQGKVADVMASAAAAPPCSSRSTISTPATGRFVAPRSPSNVRTGSCASGRRRRRGQDHRDARRRAALGHRVAREERSLEDLFLELTDDPESTEEVVR